MTHCILDFPKDWSRFPCRTNLKCLRFMDGPVVLAGLNPVSNPRPARREDTSNATFWPSFLIRGISLLTGDPAQPENIPDP